MGGLEANPLLVAFGVVAFMGMLYLGLAVLLFHRARLSDGGLEVVQVPLPTTGHHAALVHHPAQVPRFRTPVILCHGLAVGRFNMDLFDDGQGRNRASLARTLSSAGFDVWVLELRGRGHAVVPRRADWSIDDEVREDVPCAIEHVLAKTGAPDLIWVGHSKGSLLQFLFHARGHALASKVRALAALGSPGTTRFQPYLKRLVAPARLALLLFGRIPLRAFAWLLVPLSPLIHVLGRRLDPVIEDNDGEALARILASLPASISGGVARQMMQWVRREDGALSSIDGVPDEAHFDRLKMPLLLLAGSHDLLAPPDALAWVRDRAGSSDIEYQVLGRASGWSRDYGHGDLLVGRHAPSEVYPVILRWLEAHAEPLLPGSSQNGTRLGAV